MDNTNKTWETLSKQSYEICRQRFDTETAAVDYAKKHILSRKGKQEMHCIQRALSTVKPGALILDLPCGTGRLTYFLSKLGYQVIGADYSHHMIDIAKQNLGPGNIIQFEQQDVLQIKHPANTFAATVCNRLFHHYPTAEIRRLALLELARVTAGPLIISFFNSYSLSGQWRKIKNHFKKNPVYDRLPIPFYEFKKDIESCGLTIEKTFYCAFGLSPQTYVRLIKR